MKTELRVVFSAAVIGLAGLVVCGPTNADETTRKFDFGSGPVAPGYTQVLPTTIYSTQIGYGFESGYGYDPGKAITSQNRGKPDALRGDFLTADKPFLFSVALPEGNYNVTVILGDQTGVSNTSVKAEARRLMLEAIQTAAGQFETRTFTVNVHTPKIPGGKSVALNSRELGPPLLASWDDKLTLEFNGPKPCVCAVEITPVTPALTVFLAGDSTVTDSRNEPWAAWGQMLPRFFKPGIAVANYAEAGLSLGSFKGQRRQDKMLSAVKPGDYVLIQFGHNDQKDKGEGAGPFTSYKANLKDLVAKVRDKGALPVIVTPMERRRWSSDGKPQETLTSYAEAARQAGTEEQVPIIDLHAMSLKFYESMGPEGTKKVFVHYAANTFPGRPEAFADDTHFNNYGAYELARCVVEGIKTNIAPLAKSLGEDVKPFDPTAPDPVDNFDVPISPVAGNTEKPAGS